MITSTNNTMTKTNLYKTTITILLVLFASIGTFGQTTETRYYNGKYTKETALKKVNEYLKITQSDGRLKFGGGASSTYQIEGVWEQKINEKDKIVVGVRYLIEDKSLSISIVSAVVHKDGGLIALSPKSTNEAIRKAYISQYTLYIETPFKFLEIENNTTQNNTTTTGANTSGQTTETRYYNGKYTKETGLQKTNEYITQLKNKGFNFTKTEGKSVYQFSGTWSLNNGVNTTIEYVVGDNNLTVKLTKSTNKGMNLIEIVRDEKHHLHGAVKALYDVEVLNYITKLFDYLQIKNNTTSNISQTTTTTGSNTSVNTKPINLIGKPSTVKITADTKYGFADEKGNLVISYQFQDYQKFSDGFAFVKLNDKWGVIDHKGKTVVPFKYDYALEFSEGLAGVKLNNKWGFINTTGKEVIPIQYQGANDFSEGLASVALNGKWGFIDKAGKLIIPYRYDYKEKFFQGLAGMSINNKYGFIDKTGKIVIPFIYDNVFNFNQDGKAQVRLGSESFYIDKTGKRINN